MIVQFGGQTPLKLAKPLEDAGIPILGTSPDAIDLAEDRERFQKLLVRARPEAAGERHRDLAARSARRSPRGSAIRSLLRPSYVLGGRAMEIVHDVDGLERYMRDGGARSRATTRC